MNPDRRSLQLIFVSSILAVISFSLARGALFKSKTIHATGEVVAIAVEVYADPDCAVVLNSIDWGRLYPEESRNTTFYVQLFGNTPSTLGLSTYNFVPVAAEQYLALTWDYDGYVLNPGDVLEVTVTLTVSFSITGIESFSFDVIVTACEVV